MWYTLSMEKKNAINIRVDDIELECLKELAQKETTTGNVSEIIRKAIQFYADAKPA